MITSLSFFIENLKKGIDKICICQYTLNVYTNPLLSADTGGYYESKSWRYV